MSQPMYEVPGQHQLNSGARASAVARVKPRNAVWAVLTAAVGYGLFAVPIIVLVFLAMFNSVSGPGLGGGHEGAGFFVFLCVAGILCMVASPVLMACAFTFRKLGLWIAAICTAAPALVVAVMIYIKLPA
ncbi:hypothetical protein AS189_17315 [Arthrobacter alpinus]|uniref:Uncharacterized protein n=1 Tax=Arthrobacter alpinus TaxID=656366 RepID=A0A0S2M2K2_9MICC|nr:hypothetical protein [Arthrobacter alpinus]ALO67919.1 hypothetical protein AS189_17315 [Arthrobacter alpinus]